MSVRLPVSDRVSHMYATLQRHLFSHARIRIKGRRRRFGTAAGSGHRDVTCWRGVPRQMIWKPEFGGGLERQICHREGKESSCWAHRWEEQSTLLARIPLVADFQSAWLILLHCAAARANSCEWWSHSLLVRTREHMTRASSRVCAFS